MSEYDGAGSDEAERDLEIRRNNEILERRNLDEKPEPQWPSDSDIEWFVKDELVVLITPFSHESGVYQKTVGHSTISQMFDLDDALELIAQGIKYGQSAVCDKARAKVVKIMEAGK